MLTKPTDAIILLYPSKLQTMKETREALGSFCSRCNLSIVEVITLDDEYDQLSMNRFVQAISHYTKPVALVTNKSMFGSILPLTLWSVLGIMSSNKITQSTRNFLTKMKDVAGKLCQDNTPDFHLLNCKEVGYLADWITEVRYFMERPKELRG